MFQRFLILLSAIALGTPSALAAETDAIIKLLEQSHAVAESLPLTARAALLQRQAEIVSGVDLELARKWANELFNLSFETQGNQRLFLQNNATMIMLRLDFGRGVELFHRMSTEKPDENWAANPPQMLIAEQVFLEIIAREGASAMPRLKQEAELMGARGQYPYAALGRAALSVTSKNLPEKQDRVELLRPVLDSAFARYSQSVPGYRDDFEFGKMLSSMAAGLPFELVKAPLHRVVENLLATGTSKYQLRTEVYSSDGRKMTLSNMIDSNLFFFQSLIKRDPELLRQLQESRPEFRQALELTKNGRPRAVRFLPAAQAKNAVVPQQADTAMGASAQLSVIAAQASAAATRNEAGELSELLRRGFSLAEAVVLEMRNDNGRHSIPGLAPLVQIGIKHDAALTNGFLERIAPSYVKAELLITVAASLQGETAVAAGARLQ